MDDLRNSIRKKTASFCRKCLPFSPQTPFAWSSDALLFPGVNRDYEWQAVSAHQHTHAADCYLLVTVFMNAQQLCLIKSQLINNTCSYQFCRRVNPGSLSDQWWHATRRWMIGPGSIWANNIWKVCSETVSQGLTPQAQAQKSCSKKPAAKLSWNAAKQHAGWRAVHPLWPKLLVPRGTCHVSLPWHVYLFHGPKSLKSFDMNLQHDDVWLREIWCQINT